MSNLFNRNRRHGIFFCLLAVQIICFTVQVQTNLTKSSAGTMTKLLFDAGTWIVQTRSYAIQPFFTSDFPQYDENQFISAAATNWADLALLEGLPDKNK